MKVACFGREGSFAHQAAQRRFGSLAAYLSCPTHSEVVDALLARRADTGVLPIDNSVGGVVMETIDSLVAPECVQSRLKIREYLQLAPDLVLLTRLPIQKIRRVYSHPYPLRYLSRWLKRNLPKAEYFETVSTSEAAQLASEQPEAAAIAGPQAARIYGLKIAKKGLARAEEYTTRFCVISAKPIAKNKPTHAALCFGLKHRPGALVAALAILADHRLNLTRIISRPLSSRTGKFNSDAYLFWIDVDIRIGENIFNAAIRELHSNTTFLDILGAYFIRSGC